MLSVSNRYSPNPRWYVDTILCVLEISDGSVCSAVSSSRDDNGRAEAEREKPHSQVKKTRQMFCGEGGFSSSVGGFGSGGSGFRGGVCTALCYSTAYSLMQLIAEGIAENEEEDRAFRVYAAQQMLHILRTKRHYIPDVLMQVRPREERTKMSEKRSLLGSEDSLLLLVCFSLDTCRSIRAQRLVSTCVFLRLESRLLHAFGTP